MSLNKEAVKSPKDCIKCNNTGFTGDLTTSEPLKKCVCMFTRDLKAYLPKMFAGDQVAKKFPFTAFQGKNIRTKGNIRKFGSLANTLLMNHFLRNPEFKYSVVGYTTFIEQFFEGEVSPHYEADLLILLVYGGYKHSKTEEYLYSLLKDRELNRKPTLVFFDKDLGEALVKDRLGATVVKHIESFTSVNI
jgi:hypothetical protein